MEADSDDVVFIKCDRSMVCDEVNLVSPDSAKIPKPIKLPLTLAKQPQKAAKRIVMLGNPGTITESLVITREVLLKPPNIKFVVNINTSTCHHKEWKRKRTHSKSKKEVLKASSDQSDVEFVPQVQKKSEDIPKPVVLNRTVPQVPKKQKDIPKPVVLKRTVPQLPKTHKDILEPVVLNRTVPQVPKKQKDIPKPVVLKRTVPQLPKKHKDILEPVVLNRTVPQVPKKQKNKPKPVVLKRTVPQLPKKHKDIPEPVVLNRTVPQLPKKHKDILEPDVLNRTVPQLPKKHKDIPKPVVLNRIVPMCGRTKCLPDIMKCKTKTEGIRKMREENNNNVRKCSNDMCRDRPRKLRRKCHKDIPRDRRHKRHRSRSPREKRCRLEDRKISPIPLSLSTLSLSLSPISLGSIEDSNISYDDISSDNFSMNSEDELETLIKRTKKREREMVRKLRRNNTERVCRPIRSPLPFAEILNASTPNNFNENSDATVFSSEMDVTIHSLSTVVLDRNVDVEVYSPTVSPNELLCPRICLDDTIELHASPQIDELEDRNTKKIKAETLSHLAQVCKEKRTEASIDQTKNIKREAHRCSNQEIQTRDMTHQNGTLVDMSGHKQK